MLQSSYHTTKPKQNQSVSRISMLSVVILAGTIILATILNYFLGVIGV